VTSEAHRPSQASPTAAASTAPLPLRRGMFVSWAKLRRADTIAAKLGMPSYTVRYFYAGTPLLLTIWKYFLQAVRTFFLLLKQRPAVVFVTSPPVFAVAPVWLYASLFRARYVVDHHSGCFLERSWQRWDRLQGFFARHATINLVHNRENAREAERWHARTFVFPSLPPLDLPALAGPRPPGRKGAAPGAQRVVYICSFKSDEPFDTFFAAAKDLPSVEFFVTGRPPEKLHSDLPTNVQLTGFLREKDYLALLISADLIVALTTRGGTLLYGAQEAIALAKPLLLSRMPTLEAYFSGGAVFAANEPESLREGIRSALARRDELSVRMGAFRDRCVAEGEERLDELRRALAPRPEIS
jgi:glycosyltransferase involved in cell wall biosynthesis